MDREEYLKNAAILEDRKQWDALKELTALYQAQLPKEPVDYDAIQSIKNFPSSLAGVFGDLYTAVTNPIDTTVALGTLARSGIANAGQMLQDALPLPVVSGMNRLENFVTGRNLPVGEDAKTYRVPRQEAGEAFVGMLDDRYGDMDALKTTAMEDPAGLLLDLSSVLTGGGTIAAKTGGQAAKVGDAMKTVGNAIDPLTGTVKAPVALIESATGQPVSRQLYQSAMKPSTTLTLNDRTRLLDAGLELGATPTLRSQNKVQAKKNEVYREIEELENTVDASTLSPQGRLFEHVDDVKKEYLPPVIDTVEVRKTIDGVVDQQLEALFLNGGKNLTVKELSAIKKRIYDKISDSYSKKAGESPIDKPSEQTMKAIARSAKEQIEELIPEIKALNAKYGTIVDVQEKIQNPAAARVGNRDLVGIGMPVKVTAGAALDGTTGGVFSGLLGMVDAPVTKSNLAVATNRAGKAVRSPNNPFRTLSLAGRYEQAVLADEEEREREKLEKELRRQDN